MRQINADLFAKFNNPDSGFQPWRRLEGRDRWSMVVRRWPEENFVEKIRLFIEALVHSTSNTVHKIISARNANNPFELLEPFKLLNQQPETV